VKLDQIPVHVDVVGVEISRAVLAVGVLCLIAAVVTIVWLVIRRRSGR
jgi:hypothetical protein